MVGTCWNGQGLEGRHSARGPGQGQRRERDASDTLRSLSACWTRCVGNEKARHAALHVLFESRQQVTLPAASARDGAICQRRTAMKNPLFDLRTVMLSSRHSIGATCHRRPAARGRCGTARYRRFRRRCASARCCNATSSVFTSCRARWNRYAGIVCRAGVDRTLVSWHVPGRKTRCRGHRQPHSARYGRFTQAVHHPKEGRS